MFVVGDQQHCSGSVDHSLKSPETVIYTSSICARLKKQNIRISPNRLKKFALVESNIGKDRGVRKESL